MLIYSHYPALFTHAIQFILITVILLSIDQGSTDPVRIASRSRT